MPDDPEDRREPPQRSHPQVSNRRRSRSIGRRETATDATEDAVEQRLEWFAKWSDDVFRIPGTSVRVGLEPLIGLLPGVGDAAGLIVSLYVPIEAWRQGAPGRLIGSMLGTIAIDGLVGLVPVLGDLFDITYRANRRNVRKLQDWMEREA
ncbi:MAG: DUF4112 domain-containing protein [Bacteroidetes bacterium]|jgi:hypothetical protein|nr:DUF4112 domain-containing protein [Bacteroidota bacterium]